LGSMTSSLAAWEERTRPAAAASLLSLQCVNYPVLCFLAAWPLLQGKRCTLQRVWGRNIVVQACLSTLLQSMQSDLQQQQLPGCSLVV
jgi:hypothetical protein